MLFGVLSEVMPFAVKFGSIFAAIWLSKRAMRYFMPWIKMIGQRPWR